MPRGDQRIVIVGASLAGVTAAEALRAEGFGGSLTLVGDEPYGPYDRPALSKRVLAGRMSADATGLPVRRELDAHWRLGVPASRLDRTNGSVVLDDGTDVPFDRLLVATGTRAVPWPDPDEAALEGVCTIRTRDDAEELRSRLAASPKRVLVIGAGFIGCEAASVCRELGLEVTVVERGSAPLSNALGGPAGTSATRMLRDAGVDLRTHVSVMALEGDEKGRLKRARLSDGDFLDVDVAVVALGARRNVEWLDGAGLDIDRQGVACDATCRALDEAGHAVEHIFVAGDVARWPHPVFGGHLIAVEHWGNAVEQAKVAAHNMVRPPSDSREYAWMPAFWSNQFGNNIKSVGVPTLADQVAVVEGSVEDRCFVAAYGRDGRVVAALAVNSPRTMDAYARMIELGEAFPPPIDPSYRPARIRILDAGFPAQGQATHSNVAGADVPAGSGPSSAYADARTPFEHPPL